MQLHVSSFSACCTAAFVPEFQSVPSWGGSCTGLICLPPHDGVLAALGEPLCCVPHAPNCWQWLKSGFLLLPTSKCRNSELGTHKTYLAGKVVMGFCYLCGFVFLKRNSFVSLVFSDFSPACCASLLLFPHFQKHNFVPYYFKHSPFLPFLPSLLAFLAMTLSLSLLVTYLLPVRALSLTLSRTAPSYSRHHQHASPQHTSSALTAFLSSHQKCKISQETLSIALGL